MKIELNSKTVEELRELMVSLGEPAFRGNQLFTHFHKKFKTDLQDVKGLPKTLSERLGGPEFTVAKAEIVKTLRTKNLDTEKYGMRLTDGQIIEAVFMRYRSHNTLCISTQIGCAMGCAFCASTKSGLFRNLTAGEMLAQYYSAVEAAGEPIQNLVLMGIGEPLENYDHVVRALKILHDPEGRDMSYRNISLSTCGVVPGILRLSEEGIPINLVVSLHAATDEKRRKIMPIAKRYSLAELMKACQVYFERTGRRISYEYTLIPGVNDTKEDVEGLQALLKDKGAHINLISYHPIKEYDKNRPEEAEVHRFAKKLTQKGITTTVRKSSGLETDGACGQLRAQGIRNSQEVPYGNSNQN